MTPIDPSWRICPTQLSSFERSRARSTKLDMDRRVHELGMLEARTKSAQIDFEHDA